MRTAVDLPDHLIQQLKMAAIAQGREVPDLLASLVTDGLRKSMVAATTHSSIRSSLPEPPRLLGGKIPALTNRRIAELFDTEDGVGQG